MPCRALGKEIVAATADKGGLMDDSFCVRKGARVLTPLNPPVNGGTSSHPLIVEDRGTSVATWWQKGEDYGGTNRCN